MTTVKITIDDSLSFSELKAALSLIRGVLAVEIADTDQQEDDKEHLKEAFFAGSKRAMAKHFEKYL
ncbi:MAG: hypothetical protein PHI28_16020 [Mangrovibacterium sp.]|nr:hypothetical protein [Mangrovibacterium sp.]